MSDINFDGDISASFGGALQKITFTLTDAQLSQADKLAVRAWVATSGSRGAYSDTTSGPGAGAVLWGNAALNSGSSAPKGRVLPEFTSIATSASVVLITIEPPEGSLTVKLKRSFI